ncbi:hypothetical protein T10_5258 [Trichinella papuae]|uniref:Uncharacterized protein n=1 Tax=Trichinella papuae TaxID=268474 RepID=A0A0V1MA62_9BILA|nr:hypothetical protein T10_5258 [Trichinella papuae]
MMNLRKIEYPSTLRRLRRATILKCWQLSHSGAWMNQKLLSIHDLVSGNLVAAVNCFSTCKDIRTCGLIFQPNFILNAQIQGCYFYFCQVVLRNVLERGRNVQYSQKMIQKEK